MPKLGKGRVPSAGLGNRLRMLAACLTVACLGLLAAGASARALNLTGSWSAVYHCEAGFCKGEEFPATDVLTQAEGSSEVTGSNGVESIHGTLSGNSFAWHSGTCCYSASATLTISADGSSWSGHLSDSLGSSGTYVATRASTTAIVSGSVIDEMSKPAKGVTVKLSGTSDGLEAISKTTTSAGDGSYSFEVPAGTYTVNVSGDATNENGGKLEVRQSSATRLAECDGTASPAACALNHVATGEHLHAGFLYTHCADAGRLPNGKPPTGCPIIFIPGFLGSRLQCSTGEVWTGIPIPDWADMRLSSDGVKNGAYGACSATVTAMKGEAGVVRTAASKDIYGEALAYLNRIAPGRVYAYPYDWRKSPLLAQDGLQEEVERVLAKTHASRVVLMAHSMGGLVLQKYVSEPAHAEKVIRAVTLGTPYWGAPKSQVALMTGKSNEVEQETFGLDLFTQSSVTEAESSNLLYIKTVNDLQLAARTMQGLYWLAPSERFGPWLQVKGPGYPLGLMASGQLRSWVSSLGGTAALLSSAVAGHNALDAFKTNGVDYQVMVGVGVPTMSAASVEENPTGATQPVSVWYGSGDGTVPARSATQGASEGSHTPLGDNVPVHYACGVDHLSLPANAAVQSRIEGFLLRGDPVSGPENNCEYTGVALKLFEVPIAEHGLAKASVGGGSNAGAVAVSVVTSGGGTLSLKQARQAGLVQALQVGGVRYLVTGSTSPVALSLSGSHLAFQVQGLKSASGTRSGSGPPVLYGPVSGAVTIGPTGMVMRGGKRVRPARRLGKPHTSAHLSGHGRRVVLTLSARAPAGVAGIFVSIGKHPARRYVKPLVLSRSELRTVRFRSVDRFGRWEAAQRIRG